MAVVALKVTRWSLQIMENGVRRLDLDLLPLGTIIEEVPQSGSQRCFIADPDHPKTAKLIARHPAKALVPKKWVAFLPQTAPPLAVETP